MTTLYLIESTTEDKKVLITSDKSKFSDRRKIDKFPLHNDRALISDLWQWWMIEAYINEKWSVEMDEDAKNIWESRPKGFDTRHDNPTKDDEIFVLSDD